MKFRSRRVGLLLLLIMGAVALMGASRPLNPLITRRPEPVGGVSSECAESIADTPLAPRVDITEVPLPTVEPREPVAPPSADLRARLRAAQDALERNDRATFGDAVASLRTLLDTYPRGGERQQAEELLRTYADISRLWDAQFESPFFGEDSPLYATLNAYPGWAEHVRRRVLVDDRERRFYPIAESREFLTATAAARLGGSRAPIPQRPIIEDDGRALPPVRPRSTTTPAQQPSRSTATSPAPQQSSRRATTAPAPQQSSRRATTSPAQTQPSRSTASASPQRSVERRSSPSTSSSTSSRSSASTPPASTERSAARTRTADAGPTTPPAASPVVATSATAAPPAPSSSDTATSGTATTDTATVVDPFATDTTTTTTDATATTGTPDTTIAEPSTTTAPAAEPARGRNLLIPIILILVGIGVLILLFRSSS